MSLHKLARHRRPKPPRRGPLQRIASERIAYEGEESAPFALADFRSVVAARRNARDNEHGGCSGRSGADAPHINGTKYGTMRKAQLWRASLCDNGSAQSRLSQLGLNRKQVPDGGGAHLRGDYCGRGMSQSRRTHGMEFIALYSSALGGRFAGLTPTATGSDCQTRGR